jgi:PAS domain S-box-containing protein
MTHTNSHKRPPVHRREPRALPHSHGAVRTDSAEYGHAETIRRQNAAWLRLLTDQVPAVLWTTDTALVFTSSTGAGLRALGLRPNEMVGVSLFNYFRTRDPKFPPIATHRRALRGESGIYEREWGGRTFQTHVEPLHDANGAIIGTLGFSLDMTERREAERAIRELNEELHRRVAERTAQLQEKEVLLRELKHRVQNNLQVIISLLSLRAALLRDPQASAMLKETENRVRLMAAIHAALSRAPNLSQIDSQDFIRDIIDSLLRSYAVRPDALQVQIDVEPATLDTETAVPCGLIINELVSNALKHAFHNGRRGKIHVRLWSDRRQRCHLQVRDDGVGLPAKPDWRQPRSFGWQLMQTLVQQLGGRIVMRGKKGTTVTVSFPQPKPAHQEVVHEQPTHHGRRGRGHHREGHRGASHASGL